MIVKMCKGWVKIGETLYPIDIDDLDIGVAHITYNVDMPPNTTVTIDPQELYRLTAHANYVAPEYMYKAPPLDPGPPEMSDNDAFDLMVSIREERPWQILRDDGSA
ncbi:MAG TPA: hypothetical protein VHV10_16400 [Ktedonobacteraceae bacterium]|jgi:hypothetical protein|nr:hypothetical protein [Ktedonobacteraceae bacterium]